jgi:hypothetical protein
MQFLFLQEWNKKVVFIYFCIEFFHHFFMFSQDFIPPIIIIII